ncbi:hypothetical protein [Flavobacterium taihuense]|uniref:Lipoprotein n=1 Tax=Flavobacterium taihuense TaxID=2857508 RepID=A0ABS6Y1K4_9FLAO|nr:hypothetical protein [Flavobacterium taihuense]MBW4362762.1 hypothetical protein [Flavobacterium taihuense]
MNRINIFFQCVIFFFLVGCEKQDLCDDGYKPHESNGQTICIPDYVGINPQNSKFGNMYYHEKYGIIVFSDGIWKNENNQIIENPNK